MKKAQYAGWKKYGIISIKRQRVAVEISGTEKIEFRNFTIINPTNTTKNYFNELSRVLKPDGRIYIVGWYTPRDSAWLQKEDMAQYNLQTEDIFDQEKLLEFIDRFGITENVSKYLKVGDIPQDVIPFKSFVMVLKKTAQ